MSPHLWIAWLLVAWAVLLTWASVLLAVDERAQRKARRFLNPSLLVLGGVALALALLKLAVYIAGMSPTNPPADASDASKEDAP
jgi:hypothetical protein